jgi:hypothetical protein
VSERRRAVRKAAPMAADMEPPEAATHPIATRTPEFPRLAAAASVVRLEEGLYALGIGPMPRLPDCSPHVVLPAILLSTPPARRDRCVEIIGTSGGDAGWIGCDGGTVVVKSPPGGGDLWVTAYGPPECAMALPLVEPRRLDRPCAPPPQLEAVIEPDEIRTEIVLHMNGSEISDLPGKAGSAIAAVSSGSRPSASDRPRGWRRATSNSRGWAPTAGRRRGLPTPNSVAPGDSTFR